MPNYVDEGPCHREGLILNINLSSRSKLRVGLHFIKKRTSSAVRRHSEASLTWRSQPWKRSELERVIYWRAVARTWHTSRCTACFATALYNSYALEPSWLRKKERAEGQASSNRRHRTIVIPMKIIFLTQYYPPELGAPQARLSDLARRIREVGHEVIVLTSIPNYPQGKIYDGYSGWYCREVIDGITVHRCFIYPARTLNRMRRLWNYFSFVLSSFITGIGVLPKCDYLLVELPPPFLAVTGWFLSKAKGARLILNVADLWLDWAVEIGAIGRGLAWRFTRGLERTLYRSAWLVTGQSVEILDSVGKVQPSSNRYHLSNGVDVYFSEGAKRDPEVHRELGLGREIVALYAGVHGRAQGLNQILKAADLVRNLKNLQITFIGEGTERDLLIRQAAEMHLENVQFLGARSRSEMPAILAAADIALVPLIRRLYGAVPSKLYEAMGASLPVLLVAEGEAAEILMTSDAGIIVRPATSRAWPMR